MSKEITVKAIFDDNKNHVWINNIQYISLNRFLETQLVNQKVIDKLTKENEAYKILLKEQLNKED